MVEVGLRAFKQMVLLTACMASLEHVQGTAHIAATQCDQAIDSLWLNTHVFLLNHLVNQDPDVLLFKWAKPEPSTTGKKGGRELVGIVCDNAKPSVGSIFFHDSTKSHLRGSCHRIGFIQDDELE